MRQRSCRAFAFVSVFLMSGAGAGIEALPATTVADANMQNAPPEERRVLRLAQSPPATPEALPTAPTRGRPPLPPSWTTFPGEFAMRTEKGFYLTAINGGGRTTDPIVITEATTAGPWEKFRLAVMSPPPPNDKSIQTVSGNYLTAVNGGGMTSDALHTDATQVRDWEQFRIIDLTVDGSAWTYFAIRTTRGNYLTAIGEGGKYTDAIHTDATQINSWERLRIVKCGDIGSGYQYAILTSNGSILTAVNGGGVPDGDTIVQGQWYGAPTDGTWARFKFIRQPDGSYALQTSNGTNYVTALGGGGQVQKYLPPNCGWFSACISGWSTIFHTDATQVLGWERFKIIDQGNCKYAIQTVSGYYFGMYKDPNGYAFTTDRSTISENEQFQLIMYGLASPVVLH